MRGASGLPAPRLRSLAVDGERAQRRVVRRQVALDPRQEVAALARLGVDQAGEDALGLLLQQEGTLDLGRRRDRLALR